MYLPAHFKEDRTPVLHELIRAHPFATLVTLDATGLIANHLPMEIDAAAGPLGTLRVIDDAAWLRSFVEQLTDRHEAEHARATGDAPWHVGDAPESFLEKQLAAIVGLELPIARIEGKWKVSQNRTAEDRAGVVAGLGRSDDAVARAMAELVRERG